MNVLLMHPDRDFDAAQPPPAHAPALDADLALGKLLEAMAAGDALIEQVAHAALHAGPGNDVATIEYRQAVLRDCLAHGQVVRELYALAIEALERKRRDYFGFMMHYPSSILRSSVGVLRMFLDMLLKLRAVAVAEAPHFASEGFRRLFSMLERELGDAYVAEVRAHLEELRFEAGVLIGAGLGEGNEGVGHVLHLERDRRPAWMQRLLGPHRPAYSFRLAERDSAGARYLAELQDRGINLVANALAQSMDHIASFFEALRTELAFYVGALNLHDQLSALGAPTCLPRAREAGTGILHASGLYDPCLALQLGRAPVGNGLDADARALVVITGANQGGKSSFLRAVGLAHLMLGAGLFAAAGSLEAAICRGLFTHHKREEDAAMRGGKFDEELRRLDAFADAVVPGSLALFNESFSSTNEREGAEVARGVVDALLERRIRVFFVTHQFALAGAYLERRGTDVLYLRAERAEDGRRSFRLAPGEPLPTSYGADLYREIFGASA